MLRLSVGLLLLVPGTIARWFVEEGTPRFGIVQMAIAVLLFTLMVFLLAVWPARWLKRFHGLTWWMRRISERGPAAGAIEMCSDADDGGYRENIYTAKPGHSCLTK